MSCRFCVLLLLGAVSACGGGSGDAGGADSGPSTPRAGFAGGAPGTGYSSGPVKGFDSIVVADRALSTDDAVVIVEGQRAQLTDIAVGQQVAVIADWESARALEVRYRSSLRGAVGAVYIRDPARGYASLRVLEQMVRIEPRTVITGGSIDGLVTGRQVEISGSADEAGTIRATYVRFISGLSEYKLIGTASAVTDFVLRIGNLLVDYSAANLIDLTPGQIAGRRIEVRGAAANYSGRRFQAGTVENLPSLSVADTTPIEVEGVITSAISSTQFRMADAIGERLVLTEGATVEDAIGGGELAPGTRVEVLGTVDGGGAIRAQRIEIENSELVRFEGPISASEPALNRLLVDQLEFFVRPTTVFEDESSTGLSPLSPDDISGGDFIVLSGFLEDGEVIATDIRRRDLSQGASLTAPASSASNSSGAVQMLGVAFSIGSSTAFSDADEIPTSRASLFTQIQPGDRMRVRWATYTTLTETVSELGMAVRAYPEACTIQIRDTFDRTSLGSEWVAMNGSLPQIFSNSYLGTSNNDVWLFVRRVDALPAAQFAEIAVAPGKPDSMLVQAYVRQRLSDDARYGFHYNGDPGSSRWEIKYDGVPSAETRVLAAVDGDAPAPGDTLRLRVSGLAPVLLSAYVDDRLVLEAADTSSSRISGGPVGTVGRRTKDGPFISGDIPIVDTFSAGSCP